MRGREMEKVLRIVLNLVLEENVAVAVTGATRDRPLSGVCCHGFVCSGAAEKDPVDAVCWVSTMNHQFSLIIITVISDQNKTLSPLTPFLLPFLLLFLSSHLNSLTPPISSHPQS